jgi:signal transduction histidine kinase/CheY-like chemotaxis protein
MDDGSTLWHGIISDVTDRKLAEEKLLKQNQEIESQYEEYMQLNEVLRQTNFDLEIAIEHAQESDKLKTAFLQNVSHEIRTPLNGIIGFSNLLQAEDITKEEINEFTGIIQQSGTRLIEIVNNVLDISKIETGQKEVHHKSISINSIITDLYSFFSPVANAKNISLNYYYGLDDANSVIGTDDTMLNQILTNLINNAIKFTSTGFIDFGYEISDQYLQFYVKDTGTGIPNELQEKIFERFIQAETSITRGYEGAGLGLAICKGLVDLLGGKIWVVSEVGLGSTFYFTIPYSPNKVIVTKELEETKKSSTIKTVKVLIAEDDYTSYLYLRSALKRINCEVIWVENGEKAIEAVNNNTDIELILMDIRMPVMDGIEAITQIKRIRPDIPIIAQTAYAFSQERDQILMTGCEEYVSKPIETSKLMKLIDKYIN